MRIGGVLYELDSDLDKPVRNHIPFWGQYGFLGRHGLCSADCDFDECGVLEHKATKSGSDAIAAALNPTLTSRLWGRKSRGEQKKRTDESQSSLFHESYKITAMKESGSSHSQP